LRGNEKSSRSETNSDVLVVDVVGCGRERGQREAQERVERKGKGGEKDRRMRKRE